MTVKNQKIVFIPKKLKIGFVDREETELGRLAFVTCFDEKGAQRQEKSFNSWRDHNIDPLEWTNEPRKGFRVASSIKRTYDSHYGQRTEKIRIIDPRGAEFEISVANLIFILDHSDIINQEITSELIYAWDKADLILLPTNSRLYKENVKIKNEGKIKAKDLKVGSPYLTNSPDETAMYLGEFYYVPLVGYYSYKSSIDEVIKYHKNKDKIIEKGVILENYIKALKKQHLFMIKRFFPHSPEKAHYVVQPLTIAYIKGLKEECSELSEQQIEEINELCNFSKTKPTENIKNEELKLNSYYYEKINDLEFYTTYSSQPCDAGFWSRNENNTECVELKSKIHSAKTKNDPVRIALEAQNYKVKKIFNVEKMCKKDKTFVNNGQTVYTDVKYLVFGDVEIPVKTESNLC